MKILVATATGQGGRPNDFHWADEGEPVVPAFTCDRATPDDGCGCARAFAGCRTLKATTTAMVADAGTYAELCEAVAGWYRRFFGVEELDEELGKAVLEDASTMVTAARGLPVGTVVERRGDNLRIRRPKAPVWSCVPQHAAHN